MIHFDETGDWGQGKSIEKPDKNTFKRGAPHTHAPSMIRTQVMKDVGGYTDTKQTIRIEDYYLWYKIYKAGYKGYNLQEHLYKMRDDKDAMARRTFKNRVNAFRVKNEILKGIGIKYPIRYSVTSLLKGFIPVFIMKIIRKQKMKKNSYR